MSDTSENTPVAPPAEPSVHRLRILEHIAQRREESLDDEDDLPSPRRPAVWNDLWTIERPPTSAPADTETLLNGLIDECGFLMREVAFRLMRTAPDEDELARHIGRAMSLANTGANLGLAVAKVRKASSRESRRSITLEQVERGDDEKRSIRENQ